MPPQLSLHTAAHQAASGGARHYVVRLRGPASRGLRERLAASGITLLRYLGDHSWFAAVDGAADAASADAARHVAEVLPISREWKLHPLLLNPVGGGLPVQPDSSGQPRLAAYIVLHADVDAGLHGAGIAARHGGVVRSVVGSVNALVAELPLDAIQAMADEDAVQWIEPALPKLGPVTDSVRALTQAELVQLAPPDGYGLDGSGVSVLVYDGGTADDSHPDLAGRTTPHDESGLLLHSTHVAGIVAGSGAVSGGLYRGMAPGAMVESYGLEALGSVGLLYNNPGDIEADFDAAMNTFGADLASVSLGTNTCFNGLFYSCNITGDYGVTDQLIDSIVAGSLGSPFRIIWANGNERACTRCTDEGVTTPEGFHSTAPPACAKNQISVGAVNSDDDSITYFTSWGPCDDGRMRPDVVAPGCQNDDDFGVTSCDTEAGYTVLCGTSMATPAVSGLAALLLQDFHEQYPELPDPRNCTLKALLAHNAADLALPGPDYQSGFGSVRIADTIDFLRTGNFLEGQVEQGGAPSVLVEVGETDTVLRVTLAWDDAPGTPNVVPSLINDLDLVVIDPDLQRHDPWTLTPSHPGAPAFRIYPDRLNNIEQVFVSLPKQGVWRVSVLGYDVPEGPQPYGLTVSPRLIRDCDGDGVPDVEQIAADPGLDCTGDGVLDACESDCDADGTSDSCAIAAGAEDCDLNGVPDACQPDADCNGNGRFDACDIRDGASTDCDLDGTPDDCAPDCNGNGTPDLCDVRSGESEDCNLNFSPDECDLADGRSHDCNDNAVPDECDIAAGVSEDFNDTRVPDECEPNTTFFLDDDAPADPGPGDAEVSDPDEDGTEAHPFDSIQEAIDRSISGDELILADGLYAGLGNREIDFGGRSITVRSANGPDAVTIDAQRLGRAFHFQNGESSAARIEGLRLINGSAFGGGVLCTDSSPTIANCVFFGNRVVGSGAALHCDGGSPTVTGCTFEANVASSAGAAVFCRNGAAPVLTDCTIRRNYAGSQGGALGTTSSSNPVLERCVLEGNLALNFGGAVYMIGGVARFVGCQIVGNFAFDDGGGVYVFSGSPTLESCLIARNGAATGGGVYLRAASFVNLLGCTIADNHASRAGDALYARDFSAYTLSGCIMWDHEATDAAGLTAEVFSTFEVDFSAVQGGEAGFDLDGTSTLTWGTGNIAADPLLRGPAGGDYHLLPESPCVDSGAGADVDPAGLDVDGEPRVQVAALDIGADEYNPDCNANGTPDADDVARGSSQDCNANAVPDECESDCNANGLADACDVAGGTSADCTDNGIPDECESDCNGNGAADTCDLAAAVSTDCNVNGVPDECDLATGVFADCNVNAVLDVCDLVYGSSTDCNSNLIPDECEDIEPVDCNANGIPDDCDLAAGTSEDVNDNEVPDECESNRVIHVVAAAAGESPIPPEDFEDGSARFPFDTILEAFDQAIDGDVVLLHAGVFRGPENKNLTFDGRDIIVRGEPGAVIDLEGDGRAFFIGTGVTAAGGLDRLTIMNGQADSGGAVFCVESTPTIRNCLFVNNYATQRGGAISCTTDADVTIRGCTFYGNESAGTGGAFDAAGAEPVIENCILWGNAAATGHELATYSGTLTVRYCNVAGGEQGVARIMGGELVWGEGNQAADPLFADPAGEDGVPGTPDDNLRLATESPVLDAGDPEYALVAGDAELDGHTRVLCGRVDMGAYEAKIGDVGCDGLVALSDYALWPGCMTGPGAGPYPTGCEVFDFVADGEIDLRDFAGFANTLQP